MFNKIQSKYHALVKNSSAPEESLFKYKKNIPEMKISERLREEEISSLINTLTLGPCFVQIFHPDDEKGALSFDLLTRLIKNTESEWASILADMSWVSFNHSGNYLTMSFTNKSIEISNLESTFKSMCLSSQSFVSFNIQNHQNEYRVNIRLEAETQNQLQSERGSNL